MSLNRVEGSGFSRAKLSLWLWRSFISLFCILLLSLLIFIFKPWPEEYPLVVDQNSVLLFDSDSSLLREVHVEEGTSKRWIPLKEVPTWVREAFITAEDRRFYYHCGFDPLAIVRSAYCNLEAGKVIMGGSTINEQLTRLLLPARPRTFKAKLIELLYSLRLSCSFSKDRILEAYLNRVYFGGQAYGLEAASQLYFGCHAQELSPAQGAFLAVLVRSPKELSPYKDIEPALYLQNRLLADMATRGVLNEDDLPKALSESIKLHPLSERFDAPHFCDYVTKQLAKLPSKDIISVNTTLNYDIQKYAEKALNHYLNCLNQCNVKDGSVVVLDIKSGDILAMVGSRNYFRLPDGQNNGCLALRQPGSTLKPFTYALALQHDFTAASILPDLNYLGAMLKDAFVPENYDRRFHGPIRLRQALACSYNVPAVYVLQKVGINSLLELLRNLGLTELSQSAQYYGLGLTLGNGEVSLLNLTNAYRALANRGEYLPLQFYKSYVDTQGKKHFVSTSERLKNKFIPPEVCDLISDILADNRARSEAFGYYSALNFPFRCSVKTGTSKGYRDNWCIGYDDNFVVGVWTGNFDASSMRDVSGITGAAPIFRDVMKYVHKLGDKKKLNSFANQQKQELEGKLTKTWICAESGAKPGPYCYNKVQEYFLPGTSVEEICQVHKLYCFSKADKQQPVNPRSSKPSECYTKVVAVYPSLYRAWMKEHNMPIPPEWALYEKVSSVQNDNENSLQAIANDRDEYGPLGCKIIFPEDGAVFRLDPFLKRQHQRVNLRALAQNRKEKLTWKIDGKNFQVSSEPHIVSWPLSEGVHRITLYKQGSEKPCDTITVMVNP